MRGGIGMQIAGWLLAIATVTWFYYDHLQRETNPNRAPQVTATGEVVLKRNRVGQFVASGHVNGEPVQFLLDTGATQIALSPELARRLDLKRGAPVQILTAAGPSRGYATRLDSVKLGAIEVKDIGAVVAEGLHPELVLLGMNFLRRLEMLQRADELILRPPA